MRVILCFALWLMGISASGQTTPNWQFDFGYSGGNIVHPGWNAGARRSISQWNKEKKNGKVLANDLLLGARTGFYYHKDYQTGLWLQAEIARRKARQNGKYTTFALGVGGLQSWVPNSYLVKEEGTVEFQGAKGLSYFLLSPSVEWGWDLRDRSKFFSGWYLRPRLQWHFPYFQGSNQYLLLEIGFNINTKR